MSSELSRRFFLGGSAALAATAASGMLSGVAPAAGPGVELPSFGPESGIAKLNANENPYGPSKPALEAMAAASAEGAYYVGRSVPMLKAMIAERNGVDVDQVSLSSGSSGVLTSLAVAASRKGSMLGPDLFWDTTMRKAEQQGGVIVQTPKTADLTIDLDAMLDAIDDTTAMVQITNPNNPTGLVLDGGALREFCRAASRKCLVLVDEAYNELTDDPERNSVIPLVKEGHNVAVARTFSKIYGLAGMRVGYLIASRENTELTGRFGLGDYALNQAGVAAAIASYNDFGFLAMSKSRIVEAREMVMDAVREAGLLALPSQTNFVFVNLGRLDAEIFRQKMAVRNVLIRGIYRDYMHFSRVSMGRLEDVERYTRALPAVLDEMKA